MPTSLILLLAGMALLTALPLAWALRRTPWMAILCSVLVLGSSAGLYLILGQPGIEQLVRQYREAERAAAPEIARLAQQVKQTPGDAQAWSDLGDVHMWLNHYRAAAESYRQGVLASEGDPVLILQYSKALIYADGGHVGNEAAKGLEMLLKLEPGHHEARYFLAVRKLQEGRAGEAMQEMKALYGELPPKSALKLIIDQQIGKE